MAAGDSGNFAGGLLEVIESEALIKFSEANVAVPLVTLKGEPKADQITFIAYNSGSNQDRKSTRLNSSHVRTSRMPSSA